MIVVGFAGSLLSIRYGSCLWGRQWIQRQPVDWPMQFSRSAPPLRIGLLADIWCVVWCIFLTPVFNIVVTWRDVYFASSQSRSSCFPTRPRIVAVTYDYVAQFGLLSRRTDAHVMRRARQGPDRACCIVVSCVGPERAHRTITWGVRRRGSKYHSQRELNSRMVLRLKYLHIQSIVTTQRIYGLRALISIWGCRLSTINIHMDRAVFKFFFF